MKGIVPEGVADPKAAIRVHIVVIHVVPFHKGEIAADDPPVVKVVMEHVVGDIARERASD